MKKACNYYVKEFPVSLIKRRAMEIRGPTQSEPWHETASGQFYDSTVPPPETVIHVIVKFITVPDRYNPSPWFLNSSLFLCLRLRYYEIRGSVAREP
jgi:hypothetical protein